MMNPVRRILIADDHDIIRCGVRTLLAIRQDLDVVAEAATGSEALILVRDTRPDIAIVDYSLPEMNGKELTHELKRGHPELEVLIYTMHDREETIAEVLQAGARGYVLKADGEKHLLAAVDALSMHSPYFSPTISEALLRQYLRAKPNDALGTLTAREREVVQLIAEGKINKQVAEVLGISVKTVETHRATAMHKLKLRTIGELVRYAVRNHIVEA